MLTIRALAKQFGLSRSTLLYYDRIGLLPADARTEAGYRTYSPAARTRLQKIMELRRLGLDLRRIRVVLDGSDGEKKALLADRASEVLSEIRGLFDQLRLLQLVLGQDAWPEGLMTRSRWTHLMASFGLSEAQMLEWHRAFEAQSPDAHETFLHSLGIPEAEVHSIRQRCRIV